MAGECQSECTGKCKNQQLIGKSNTCVFKNYISFHHWIRRKGYSKCYSNCSFLDCLPVNISHLDTCLLVIIYMYSHTAKYNGTEKNNNMIIT